MKMFHWKSFTVTDQTMKTVKVSMSNQKQYTVVAINRKTVVSQKSAYTVFIRIKAGLIYTQGLKYTPDSAAEWMK